MRSPAVCPTQDRSSGHINPKPYHLATSPSPTSAFLPHTTLSQNVTSEPPQPALLDTPTNGTCSSTKSATGPYLLTHILTSLAPLPTLLPRVPRKLDYPREPPPRHTTHGRRCVGTQDPRPPSHALRRRQRAHHHTARNLRRGARNQQRRARERVQRVREDPARRSNQLRHQEEARCGAEEHGTARGCHFGADGAAGE